MTFDVDDVKQQIGTAREGFRPAHIKCVLMAEAPPKSLDRFFYYPDVKRADYLFLGVAEALYPSEKDAYLLSGRDSGR